MDELNTALIGARLRKRRKDCGLTQKELAEIVKIHWTTVSRYEKGEIRECKIPVLEAFAKALNCNPAWLMGYNVQEEAFSSGPEAVLMQTAVSKQRLEALSPRIEQLTDENFVKVIEYIDFVLSKQDTEQPALSASYIRAQEIAEARKEREKKEVSAPAKYTI